ncbi:MAG TPA: hypothetical protein VFP52_07520 [Myxococcales bacterium]|nr:hypothetical protein [Myxococcales bacterium]
MKSLFVLVALVAAGALAAEPSPARPMGPRHGGGRMMMTLDPSKLETFDGTIEKVVVREMRRMKGVHVFLKTAKETVEIHLGPAWFIDNQEAKLQAGDTVSVRAARTTMMGQPALVAMDVKRGGETLRLRNDDGTPLWAAWRGCAEPPCRGPGM